MATAPKKDGSTRTPAVPDAASVEAGIGSEEAQAQRIAARLGVPYVDLTGFPINQELFRAIPVDLMFRYNFVPAPEENSRLVVVLSDPCHVPEGNARGGLTGPP